MNWNQIAEMCKQKQTTLESHWSDFVTSSLITFGNLLDKLATGVHKCLNGKSFRTDFQTDAFIKNIGIVTAIALTSTCIAVQAEGMTITERHASLMKSVDEGEKSGELTLKEAKSLRASEDKVVAKEATMKGKNGGKLSYKNIAEIEKDLNKISNRLHKQQLEKRVAK